MSSEGSHNAFALLLREHQRDKATLSAKTARTIRGRVATRWASGLGAVIVLGGLSAIAVAGPDGAHNASDMSASPIPTPSINFASVTFPLTGGPEFLPASAGLKCGEPVPASRPVDHDLSLTLSKSTVFSLGEQQLEVQPLTVRAAVRQVTTGDQGTIASSGIDFLVVKDGIIRGIFDGTGVGLEQNVMGGAVSIPRTHLVTDGVFCPGDGGPTPAGLTPGTYQVVAIGRVFSTPESVALAQALGDTINVMYLNENDRADPAALYLPGIYSCTTARAWSSALRGCLPDITADAVIDEAAGTVTVVYRTDELVSAFSTVLVSEPMTVELVSGQTTAPSVMDEAGAVAL